MTVIKNQNEYHFEYHTYIMYIHIIYIYNIYTYYIYVYNMYLYIKKNQGQMG